MNRILAVYCKSVIAEYSKNCGFSNLWTNNEVSNLIVTNYETTDVLRFILNSILPRDSRDTNNFGKIDGNLVFVMYLHLVAYLSSYHEKAINALYELA